MGRTVVFKNGFSGTVSDSVYNILLKKGEIKIDSFDAVDSIKKQDSIKKDVSRDFLDKKVTSVRSYESKDNFK